jgi:hypothetical protein
MSTCISQHFNREFLLGNSPSICITAIKETRSSGQNQSTQLGIKSRTKRVELHFFNFRFLLLSNGFNMVVALSIRCRSLWISTVSHPTVQKGKFKVLA